MGRAFEYRKAAKMKRWANMAKTFTKIGREINIAIKEGGADPHSNPRLRLAINNAKAANMPKSNIDSAIKRATDKDTSNYDEVNFEGYGIDGVAIFVEATSNNNNRTVANVRHIFSKYGGSMGVNGSVEYMFERKAEFLIHTVPTCNIEDLEMELIDYGLEEFVKTDNNRYEVICDFSRFGSVRDYLEKNSIHIVESSVVRVPTHMKELSENDRLKNFTLLEKLEEDDDVTNVYHTMKV